MRIKIISLSFLLLSAAACTQKDPEYWVKPENQTGSISGFKATPEYCELLSTSCEEFDDLIRVEGVLNQTIDAIKSSQGFPKREDLLNLHYALDSVYNSMVDACGGRCINNGSLPVLPYREVDIKAYWNTKRYSQLNTLLQSNINKLEGSENDFNSIKQMFAEIEERNTVDAMTMFRAIQLEVLANLSN